MENHYRPITEAEKQRRKAVAQDFKARIPLRLQGDALLENVVFQLRHGGQFSPKSYAFLKHYMETATRPMTEAEFRDKMRKALG